MAYYAAEQQRPILTIPWLSLHVLMGLGATFSPFFAKAWGLVVLLLGVYFTVRNRNRGNEAACWTSYYVGLELLLRMTDGYLTYEFGKYTVVLLLLLGLVVEQRTFRWQGWWAVIIALLLLPGVLVTTTWATDFRQTVLFNISGMMALCMSLAYFYKRPISFEGIKQLFGFFLLPMLSVCALLFIRTPAYDEIQFGTEAIFVTSGGFGPNQVATALGFCWMLSIIFWLYKQKVTRYYALDLALFVLFFFRAFLTFSRGGNVGAFVALFGFLVVHLLHRNVEVVSWRRFLSFFVVGALCVGVFLYIGYLSSGSFTNRFTGRDFYGNVEEDITTGRVELLIKEFELFKENPWGWGVGGSAYFRSLLFDDVQNTHNEFGRLMAEHGILGIVVILLLCVLPIKHYFTYKQVDNRALLVCLCFLAMTIMMHSALRMALPGFFYGLSLFVLTDSEDDIVYRE